MLKKIFHYLFCFQYLHLEDDCMLCDKMLCHKIFATDNFLYAFWYIFRTKNLIQNFVNNAQIQIYEGSGHFGTMNYARF